MRTLPEKDRMSAAEIEAAKKDLTGLNRKQCFQVLKVALRLSDVMDELHDEILSTPDHILYRSGTTAHLSPHTSNSTVKNSTSKAKNLSAITNPSALGSA